MPSNHHQFFNPSADHKYRILNYTGWEQNKLERLERLRSGDTPRRLMITHSIGSYWIPSPKKTKSKLQI